VFLRLRRHQLHETGNLPGQIANLFGHRPLDVAQGQQLGSEVFGKHDQTALVIDRGVHERNNLIRKLLKRRYGADEVLQRRDSNSFHNFDLRSGLRTPADCLVEQATARCGRLVRVSVP
jgi:hypothetical protein